MTPIFENVPTIGGKSNPKASTKGHALSARLDPRERGPLRARHFYLGVQEKNGLLRRCGGAKPPIFTIPRGPGNGAGARFFTNGLVGLGPGCRPGVREFGTGSQKFKGQRSNF